MEPPPSNFSSQRDAASLDGANHERFALALTELLETDADFDARFDAFADTCGSLNIGSWPACTYALFLTRPDRYLVVKPMYVRRAASALGYDLAYESTPNARVYAGVLEFASYIRAKLVERGFSPKDMIDVQGFIWAGAGGVDEAEAQRKASPGRDAHEPKTAAPKASSNADADQESATVNHEQRAARIWSVLASEAHACTTVSYAELAAAVGMHHRALKWPLELIQSYCLAEKLPPLTILVVHTADLRPGEGFVAWDVDDLKQGQRLVFGFDWGALANPFDYAADGVDAESLARELVANPGSAGDVYRRVKARGKAQEIFRRALLDAYGSACAFCGFAFDFALEAAHIDPWATCKLEDRMNVRNGLLLCTNHHKLFDANWLRLRADFSLEYVDSAKAERTYGAIDHALTIDLHDRRVTLPHDPRLWPDPELIAKRASTPRRR